MTLETTDTCIVCEKGSSGGRLQFRCQSCGDIGIICGKCLPYQNRGPLSKLSCYNCDIPIRRDKKLKELGI